MLEWTALLVVIGNADGWVVEVFIVDSGEGTEADRELGTGGLGVLPVVVAVTVSNAINDNNTNELTTWALGECLGGRAPPPRWVVLLLLIVLVAVMMVGLVVVVETLARGILNNNNSSCSTPYSS